MSSLTALREELDILKQRKLEAQRHNNTEAAKYRHSARDASDGEKVHDESANPENSPYEPAEMSDLAADPMDWTAAQWEKFDKSAQKPTDSSISGYKNLTGLAYATYQKETAKRNVDLEEYENQKRSRLEQNGERSELLQFANMPKSENVDAVVKSLQEASERKQKRRADKSDDKQYINEKNRQFNMKLDREYGSGDAK